MEGELMEGRITRRGFLKGGMAAGAVGAIGAAGALATAGLAGCAPQEGAKPGAGGGAGTATPASASFEVFQSDVLVIGGGNGGTYAAQQAIAAGKRVAIVDKGAYRHNGASGMCWDALCYWPPVLKDPYLVTTQVDQVTRQKAIDSLPGAGYDPRVSMINHGQTFPHRDADGGVMPWFAAMPFSARSGFYRHEMDDLYEDGARIFDQTMITGLFVNNGRCLGAVGIHLPTGRYRVFRAGVTIAAASGCPQFHGWLTVGYRGINSSDATGDIVAAAFRHGVAIGECEYGQYDINSIAAIDVGNTFGCGIGADAADVSHIFDANKNPIFAEGEAVGGNMGLNQRVGKLVFEDGLGTEHGGVYVHYGKDWEDRYAIMRNVPILRDVFGIDPTEDYVECVPEMFDHGASTIVDENMMTEWEGLFNVRGAGVVGEQGGPMTFNNLLYGPYTGKCALAYLAEADEIDEGGIDWTMVEEEISRLEEIRTRKASGGLRPHEVRRKIQAAGYLGFDVYRSTKMMEDAIAELQRIREQDIPRMTLADDSVNWNIEWKSAIENYNMLDMAEVSIKASLMREETRGCYYRPEFPQRDDENWNCMIAARMADGQMLLEKRALSKVEA
jgi:succinate dehydrogenase / fumarate reductase flavoprotein subunit